MEIQMKREFTAAVRKAATAVSAGPSAGKKRKQNDEQSPSTSQANKKTKITMKVGDVEVSIHQGTTNARKSNKTGVASTSPSAFRPSPSKSKAASTLATPIKPPATSIARRASQHEDNARSTPKTPARANANRASEPAVSKSSPQKQTVKSEPRLKRGHTSPTARAPKIKPEPKPEPGTNETNIRYITGVYKISCPQLEQQYPEEACVDNDAGKIWGGFELAPKSGVLLINGGYSDPDARLSFGWRARDADRGGLSFGRE